MKTTPRLRLACFASLLALILLAYAAPSRVETEKRIAFVVGNAAYPAGELATSANDAGLIAQTLQAAGFDVSGARDLDGESLRAAFRDFLEKAQESGPDKVAFVYLAGYGLQLDGENYFLPVDAKIAAATDVGVEALRVSDYTKRLAALPLKASFVVLDAARESPFAKSGPPLAGGLALTDAEPKMLLAFNATPGTVAPKENGSYGAYARALAEMIREGGLPPADVFDGVRLRVNDETKGAFVPWDASRIAVPFVFFERAPDAPPPAFSADRVNAMRSEPISSLGVQDAYAAAIERDTLQGYEDFIAAYPSDPLAKRVRALLAARREAITWRRTYSIDSAEAYWSYLNRYPRGPHVADARRRLATMAAAEEPPPSFTPMVYDVPPPPPAEIVYVDRPVLVFSDPVFAFPPPPPPPVVILAAVASTLIFPPPPPPVELFVLPAPPFVPVPVWISPPPHLAPPPNNIIFNNIHNTTVINNNANFVQPGTPGAGGPQDGVGAGVGTHAGAAAVGAGVAAGVAAGAIATRVALPPSVARRTGNFGGPGAPQLKPGQPVPGPAAVPPGGVPVTRGPAGLELPGRPGKPGPNAQPGVLGGQPGGPGPGAQPGATPSANAPADQVLPGAHGKPLPVPNGKLGGPAGRPGATASPGVPADHALPGVNGTPAPAPGPGAKRGAQKSAPQALPGAPQNPPGAPPAPKQPTAQALPGGETLPPVPGGKGAPKGGKPGQVTPQNVIPPTGQLPPNQGPAGRVPPHGRRVPPGSTNAPPVRMPKQPQVQQSPSQVQQSHPPQAGFQQRRMPQQLQQPHPPQQFQQQRMQQQFQHQRAPQQVQQQRVPQQFQRPQATPQQFQQQKMPQQVQQPRPPQQVQQQRMQQQFQQQQVQQQRMQQQFQQPRPPQPAFQQRQPPPKPQAACGMPGLPPCPH